MSLIKDFNNLLKTLAADRKMLKIFFVIICVLLVAGYFIRPVFMKSSKADTIDQCEYLKEQNKQLVGALLDIRKGLSEMATPTSYVESDNGISFASFIDTTKRPLNNNQMQQRIQIMMRKIDSALIKNRLDSLRRLEAKQFKS